MYVAATHVSVSMVVWVATIGKRYPTLNYPQLPCLLLPLPTSRLYSTLPCRHPTLPLTYSTLSYTIIPYPNLLCPSLYLA